MNTANIRWAYLISYNGNSACRLISLHQQGKLAGNDIAVLVYENLPSDAVVQAHYAGIPAIQMNRADYVGDQQHQEAILEQMLSRKIDYLLLLGFDKIIGGQLLQQYHNRIVNVHASLLPSFRGRRPIEKAISYGVRVSGVTTHFIDERIDRGIILCQEVVRLEGDDTLESAAPRFLDAGTKVVLETFNLLGSRKL